MKNINDFFSSLLKTLPANTKIHFDHPKVIWIIKSVSGQDTMGFTEYLAGFTEKLNAEEYMKDQTEQYVLHRYDWLTLCSEFSNRFPMVAIDPTGEGSDCKLIPLIVTD